MHPEGKFRAKSRKAEVMEGRSAEQIGIEFEVLEGETKSQRLAYYGSFSEAALEITIKAMRTAGWLGDDVTDLSSMSRPEVPTVELVVEHETFEGKTRAKVKWVNSGGGLAVKNPLDQAKRAGLAARMRAAVAAVDQDLRSSGAVPTTNGSGAKPAGDIPF